MSCLSAFIIWSLLVPVYCCLQDVSTLCPKDVFSEVNVCAQVHMSIGTCQQKAKSAVGIPDLTSSIQKLTLGSRQRHSSLNHFHHCLSDKPGTLKRRNIFPTPSTSSLERDSEADKTVQVWAVMLVVLCNLEIAAPRYSTQNPKELAESGPLMASRITGYLSLSIVFVLLNYSQA